MAGAIVAGLVVAESDARMATRGVNFYKAVGIALEDGTGRRGAQATRVNARA